MHKIDSSNTLFSLASDLVSHTSKNIFLTGRAGTGKTTFLKHIRENCPKQMVVVAPTGVAAINAGGVTIHSFFQLPFGPFVPEANGFNRNDEVSNKHTLLGRLRLNAERRKIIQELELLIIDEISMVRCDVLDAIDLVLRHIRFRHSERFGGVQVLFIGDLFQLPPVVKGQEWEVLAAYYQSPYFFDSHAVKEEPPVYVEFTKIYRQTEERFIDLLNKVRTNEMSEKDLAALHSRFQPEFFGESAEGYILLTTHNEKANAINAGELAKLPARSFNYKAEVEKDFPSTAFPADEILQLKAGAQVMFIKNDTDKAKRYFNGRIGLVTELTNDKIMVQCKGDDFPIEVRREKWQNIRYTLDTTTRQLNEDVLGEFNQYPLRLAWAITIHKSQGLTFEKAVIDAGKAFAAGQVYVALSRCTSLEGMVLHSKVNPGSLCADERIIRFVKNSLPAGELQEDLAKAKKAYQEKLILSVFDFRNLLNALKELQDYLLQHTTSFNSEVLPWCEALLTRLSSVQTTSEKFHNQLRRLFALTARTEDNIELHDRIKTAAAWFSEEIKSITGLILQSPASTDSTIRAKEYNDMLKEVYVQSALQNFLLQGFGGKFSVEAFQRRKKSFVAPSFGVNAYAGASEKRIEIAHRALYYQLKNLRDSICARRNQPIYLVAGSKTLEEMATFLPQTLEELVQISGFGKAKVESFGNEFLQIIATYSQEHNLSSRISEKAPKRKRKEAKEPATDTKTETLKLYQKGMPASDIARERNLTVQTIENHLAHYVRIGLIKIDDLVSREKIVLIEPELRNVDGATVAPVKEKLGNQVTWGEIRLVLAALQHENSSAHENH